mmetsp:Transcript_3516/g.7731  ORF Transcript_3516/g.7731 Transcript_3516/m.7731 type:complete len:114 (+) Transcript_3516:69-410(+)
MVHSIPVAATISRIKTLYIAPSFSLSPPVVHNGILIFHSKLLNLKSDLIETKSVALPVFECAMQRMHCPGDGTIKRSIPAPRNYCFNLCSLMASNRIVSNSSICYQSKRTTIH